MLVFTAVAAIANGVKLPSNWSTITLMGISSTAVWIFFVLALYRLDVSVLSPLYNLRTPIAVVLSVVFLGEALSRPQYQLVVLITIAGLFVAYNEKLKLKAFFQKGVGIALLGIFFSSLVGIFTKPAIAQNGYWEARFGQWW